MPSEYDALVAALQESGIPFAEYEWDTRPEGKYGLVSLDMEADDLDGDGRKQDRAWEASVDVFFQKLTERETVIQTVEEILTEICGSAWEMNSATHENANRIFHIECVCQVQHDGRG